MAPQGAPAGLPGPLPQGERLLWQGAPRWQALALHTLHLRGVAAYFALLLVWYAVSKLSAGVAAGDVALGVLRFGGLALVPLGLLCLYAWLTARTTVYTVTTRRVMMRVGIALPMTLNLPYSRIGSAGFRPVANGAGDISLAPLPGAGLSYPMLWPHARPWRMARPEPTLRAVPDAERVARLLARALAAEAAVPVSPAVETQTAMPSRGAGRRAAAAA